MDDGERQESLFGGADRNDGQERCDDLDDDELAPDAPGAGPGQLTLDPAFDYRSDRKSGRPRRPRISLRDAIAALDVEQRMAGAAAAGLVLSMFAPWWQRPGKLGLSNSGVSQFTFCELALVLVAVAVLLLLYRRAEGREFHLPLSDGTLAALAGVWCCFLLVYRVFDPPSLFIDGAETGYDPRWGIFLALGFAVLLIVAGVRGRRRYHAGESEAIAADEDATAIAPASHHP
ncbi:MAG: hypothetical protein WDZ37_05325 [Solirubrobacterales bacterium]